MVFEIYMFVKETYMFRCLDLNFKTFIIQVICLKTTGLSGNITTSARYVVKLTYIISSPVRPSDFHKYGAT